MLVMLPKGKSWRLVIFPMCVEISVSTFIVIIIIIFLISYSTSLLQMVVFLEGKGMKH